MNIILDESDDYDVLQHHYNLFNGIAICPLEYLRQEHNL